MIKTERLLLRRAEARDQVAMRYRATPPHPDLATTTEWMQRLLVIDPAGSVEFLVERP